METENNIYMIKKRSVLLSILLSIITPGLGHLYNGKLKLTLLIPISFIIITNVIYHLSLLKSFLFFVIMILILICTYVLAIIHSAFLAKKSEEYSLKYFNKIYIYVLFVIFYFGINEIIPNNSSTNTLSMPTIGMEKTILVEDMFLADMDYYKSNQLKRNDLVLFVDPQTQNQLLVKRVIAVGGDRIGILNGKILLNGKVLHEDNPNIIFENGNYYDFENSLIPENQFFCMGDNRSESLDSRMFGPVSVSSIKGKPLYIYFSNSLNRIGTDLN
jgi:signal peptidase I